jgi:hypothetical protein
LKGAVDVAPQTKEYWDLTEDESYSKIAGIFRDLKMRRSVRFGQTIEMVSMVFINFLMHEGSISPVMLG